MASRASRSKDETLLSSSPPLLMATPLPPDQSTIEQVVIDAEDDGNLGQASMEDTYATETTPLVAFQLRHRFFQACVG